MNDEPLNDDELNELVDAFIDSLFDGEEEKPTIITFNVSTN